MIRRGLALSLVLGVAAIARADAIVEFGASYSANPLNPAGYYDPGEAVTVDVYVTQVGGAEHLLRLVQFNLTGTNAALSIDTVTLDASAGHYLDADLAGGPAGIASAYYYTDPGDLGPNAAQLVMPAGGSVKVATLDITLPGAAGDYVLDLLNAGETDAELHGRVSYGFGCDAASACDNGFHTDATAPVTFLEAGAGLTEGTMTLHVIDQGLLAAATADNGSLWRTQKNIARLTFDADLTNVPSAGQILIREMQASGAFGLDLSANFAFAIELDGSNNPRILRIQDSAANMDHRLWYSISNLGGWADAAAFEVQYQVQAGDYSGDARVLNGDVLLINAEVMNLNAGDDSRFDIDGDTRVLNGDVLLANARVMSLPVPKPAGHPNP